MPKFNAQPLKVTMRRVVALAAIALTFTAAAQNERLPDPSLTPGAIRTTSRSNICGQGTVYLRQDAGELRSAIAKRYALPTTKGYEVDHLIPLGIGGANVVENLWPQPWPEAHKKDRLEWHMRDMICRNGADAATLQQAIRTDWRKAYNDYMVR